MRVQLDVDGEDAKRLRVEGQVARPRSVAGEPLFEKPASGLLVPSSGCALGMDSQLGLELINIRTRLV